MHANTGTLGGAWLRIPLASTLTELEIDHHADVNCRASLVDLGVALSALTSLTTLDLQGFTIQDYVLSHSRCVACPPLPPLGVLRLYGDIIAVTNVLKLPFRAAAMEIEVGRDVDYDERALLLSLSRVSTTIIQGGPRIHTFDVFVRHLEAYGPRSVSIQGYEINKTYPIINLSFTYSTYQVSEFFQVFKTLINDFFTFLSEIRVILIDEDIRSLDPR